jgi:SulP family sulfate permease
MHDQPSPPTSLLPPAIPSERVSLRPRDTRLERLFPFVRTAREYKSSYLRPDFVAGLTTALFTIPQGMAYALIAGFPPAAGLATSVVASILGAAFGSSEFLINGPTNAISVMVAANAALFAAQGDATGAIILLTFMIGVIQVIAALLRVGTLTRFVSEPVLTGFTAGAGIYIVVNQLPPFLGLEKKAIVSTIAGVTLPKAAAFDLARLSLSLHGVLPSTLGIAVLTFVTIRLLQRLEKHVGRRLPATFLAVVLAMIVVQVLGLDAPGAHHVKLVRDIEPLTRRLPAIHFPAFDVTSVRAMLSAALSIALMGSVEAIAIGKTLAARAGHPFDASRQLWGEAFCNLGAALVGGFASSGSFSRTAVNHEAGAVTRLSCVLSGVLALLIVLVFAPQANLIPIAALAGTLVHVGLKLVDISRLRGMFSTTTGDRVVTITTFVAVLMVEHLENALFLGIAVSIYFALRRAEGFKLRVLTFGEDGGLRELPERDLSSADEVTVLNLQGELFFAAAEELQAELLRVLDTTRARFIVLRVQEAYNVDATTGAALAHVADEARRRGGRLLLCGVRPGMQGTLERAGLLDKIGRDALFPAEREVLASTRHAVQHARALAQGHASAAR